MITLNVIDLALSRALKLSGTFSSKGLEFDTVFIAHLNQMPNQKMELESEARLLLCGHDSGD